MDFTRLTGSPDLDPVANVQPYSYRDARTHLEDIKALRNWSSQSFTDLQSAMSSNDGELARNIAELSRHFDASLSELDKKLTEMFYDAHDEMISFDPTNGTRVEGISTVISRVFDNLRIYGLFAKEFDEMGNTAKEWDEYFSTHSARHFDLGATYPRFNDEMRVN